MNNNITYEDIPCRYFKKPGADNTRWVMEAAARRAKELGITDILVATCSGKTAFDALQIMGTGFKFIAVSHVAGFKEPNYQELSREVRQELEKSGVTVLTHQHTFGGIGRAVRNRLSTYQNDEIIAFALRTFGQGTKVAIELALMAADAGLIRTDVDVISIGGSSKGADTALVLQPANSFHFFDLKVKELICKPSLF
ncbi:MAG TPA: pyruvate kinase alpha/beta domain-containing protein [Candidatus Kapabacteria bacterium]|nr:pyruvate kinase alpha/beta domain-containing protein [Candidatus Kapabacteria bacterium]